MTDFYSQNRCVCSTRSHGPLLCAFCLSFHFNNVVLNDSHSSFTGGCSVEFCMLLKGRGVLLDLDGQ